MIMCRVECHAVLQPMVARPTGTAMRSRPSRRRAPHGHQEQECLGPVSKGSRPRSAPVGNGGSTADSTEFSHVSV